MGKAVDDLLRRRLVRGRRAADCRQDERVAQRQAVISAMRRRHVGEARAVQRRHQKIARATDAVPGENPSRAVRAMRRRCETDDQQSRVGIAESRYWTRPVGVVAERAALLATDLLAVLSKPRTA